MAAKAGTKKEAFSRVLIDDQLRAAGWKISDGTSVHYEYRLPDGTFADYVLCDRHGRAMAIIEAKRAPKSLQQAAAQGRRYAEQLDGVPYVFLANGEQILFWDYTSEAYPHEVASFFSQIDLERRHAKRNGRSFSLSESGDGLRSRVKPHPSAHLLPYGSRPRILPRRSYGGRGYHRC